MYSEITLAVLGKCSTTKVSQHSKMFSEITEESSSKSFWVRILENLSLVSHLESLELDLEILAHELPGDVVLPPVRGDRQLVH